MRISTVEWCWGNDVVNEAITSRPEVADSALRVRLRRAGQLSLALLKNPTTVTGLVFIVLMIGMAVFAPLLTEPNTPDPYQMPRDWGAIAVPPGSEGHPLGTTNVGGDVLYGMEVKGAVHGKYFVPDRHSVYGIVATGTHAERKRSGA